jgi:hypothetical protein
VQELQESAPDRSLASVPLLGSQASLAARNTGSFPIDLLGALSLHADPVHLGSKFWRALLLPIALSSSAACGGREDTYYPVFVCDKGCDETNASGQSLARRRVTLSPEQYTASVERQDVIRQGDVPEFESLTRDSGWTCTVRSARDWECKLDFGDGVHFKRFKMNDGELQNVDAFPSLGVTMVFVPYCTWKQIEWHNQTSRVHDDLPWSPSAQTSADLLFALTGCETGMAIPLEALIVDALPKWRYQLFRGQKPDAP